MQLITRINQSRVLQLKTNITIVDMKKFFILCLMAFVMCSCDKPTIKTETISIYSATLHFNEVIPTTKDEVIVFEYDKDGKFTRVTNYDEETISFEQKVEYDKNKVCRVSTIIYGFEKKSEIILYNEDGQWFRKQSGYLFEDDNIAEPINGDDFDFENHGSSLMFKVSDDDTLVWSEDMYIEGVGKILQKDKYGNWTKASLFDDEYDEYMIVVREISYYD